MAGNNCKNEALELLSRNERELVARMLRRGNPADSSDIDAVGDSGDTAFLELAQLRLRNMVDKHSEALKRTRLAARSGISGNQVERAELQLWICSEALAVCRRQLQPARTQD